MRQRVSLACLLIAAQLSIVACKGRLFAASNLIYNGTKLICSVIDVADFVYATFDNTEGLVFRGSAATSSCVPVPAVSKLLVA
jgi:hypothetical protein